MDLMRLEQVRQTFQGQVKTAEWRAAIARNKGSRAQSSALIGAMLVYGQPDERLDAAEVDLTFFLKVFIQQ